MPFRRLRRKLNSEHRADIWADTDSVVATAPTDPTPTALTPNVPCYIDRDNREDSIALLGRVDANSATITFASGTPLADGTLIIDRTLILGKPSPNWGQCWKVNGTPVDEPGSRRRPIGIVTALCISIASPAVLSS